ncbi:MAG: hypothetical protein JSW28_02495 [Thermoplasmata archaeon]|nr:MAG: hypothetical protein JSW28_02495 [Thermoplasmata archaeon]
MMVNVRLLPAKESKKVELSDDATGLDLLSLLALSPDAHIITRRDSPIPLTEQLVDGESLGVISVVSGG